MSDDHILWTKFTVRAAVALGYSAAVRQYDVLAEYPGFDPLLARLKLSISVSNSSA